MNKHLLLIPAFLLIANTAFCQTVINNNDMEHQMRADQMAQREQSYEAFAGRAGGASSSFNATGVLLAKQGRYEDAIKQFDEAIHLSESYADAYYNRGVAKQKSYHFADALNDLNIAVALNPNDIRYIESDADVKTSTGDLSGAIDGYSRLIATGRAKADVYLKRAKIEFKLKNTHTALADLTKAKQMGSTGADSLMNAISPGSAARVTVNAVKKTVDTIKATPAPEPYKAYTGPLSTNPDATRYNHIALAFAKANNMPAAIRNFTLSIAADPTFASAYNNRGFAELIMHKYRDAVDDYIKCIALDPQAVTPTPTAPMPCTS